MSDTMKEATPQSQDAERVTKVARLLSDRAAEACNVDKLDNWSIYSETYIADAEAVLSALAAPVPASPVSAPEATQTDRAFAAALLTAASKSGPEAITLAAQLAGVPPCETCGFVKQHCRCPTASTPVPADPNWKEMYERREEEAHQLSEEIIRLRKSATVTDHQILDCFVTAKGEGQAAQMVAVGRAILALAAPVPAEPNDEPNMRHPKIQGLLSERARQSIRMNTIEEICDCAPEDLDEVRWPVDDYPCKPDIFAATYERAALAEPSPVGGEPVAWISVEDRLPPPFEEVLVHPRPTDYCCEAQQHKGVWKYAEYTQWGQESHPCTPTHWMPLPPPPRAQFASPSNPKEKP